MTAVFGVPIYNLTFLLILDFMYLKLSLRYPFFIFRHDSSWSLPRRRIRLRPSGSDGVSPEGDLVRRSISDVMHPSDPLSLRQFRFTQAAVSYEVSSKRRPAIAAGECLRIVMLQDHSPGLLIKD